MAVWRQMGMRSSRNSLIKDIASSSCLLVSLVTGCQLGRAIRPADTAFQPNPLRLTHYTWRGRSRGAGFYRTDWKTVEIDFTKNEIRIRGGSTRRPRPRMHRPDRSNVFDAAWHALPCDREQEVRQAVAAWLRSDRGKISEVFYSVGIEDGYTERLHLITTEGEYTFRVNPKNFSGDRIIRAPPREYQQLRNAVTSAIPSIMLHR